MKRTKNLSKFEKTFNPEFYMIARNTVTKSELYSYGFAPTNLSNPEIQLGSEQ